MIDLRSEDDFLESFGTFVRLRCTAPDCGHEDWYQEPEFLSTPDLAVTPDLTGHVTAGPGEVWIHDAFLGLSFRAESSAGADGRKE
ncbi:MAG TPA: hypothetical protein VH724_16140 [Candidatus Angelobacter sp.]|nr:hypothetical protein [Candidatus Angelobacter sp.]